MLVTTLRPCHAASQAVRGLLKQLTKWDITQLDYIQGTFYFIVGFVWI